MSIDESREVCCQGVASVCGHGEEARQDAVERQRTTDGRVVATMWWLYDDDVTYGRDGRIVVCRGRTEAVSEGGGSCSGSVVGGCGHHLVEDDCCVAQGTRSVEARRDDEVAW